MENNQNKITKNDVIKQSIKVKKLAQSFSSELEIISGNISSSTLQDMSMNLEVAQDILEHGCETIAKIAVDKIIEEKEVLRKVLQLF